jgi:hypothetical protein
MEKDTYRSQFRLPQTLFEKLKASAEENKRSLNAELVARLEASYAGADERAELRLLVIEEIENFMHPQKRGG